MVQRRHRPSLAFKTLAKLLGGNFDRDVAPQARISRAIHCAHPTGADEREDLVRAEF